ncbi:LptE family protein [Pedobacter sp. SD-b]|uniref:LptE family protein n=1 Tax=Pedobacter segetis TaxID=2793069 RepID=A0ABS1BLL3_9SPHI|nr:LptE family protein [Pedobacter segetis]MBK0383774.1 LptE family protein [Pedobacter segetis]
MKDKLVFFFIIPFLILQSGCGVYSFTGGSISAGMKTVSVLVFENTAQLVNPNLSQAFTEDLKNRIRTQTSLSFVRTDGDANFEGRITDYTIQPVAIQANQQQTAGLTRLTITVQVKYANKIEVDKSFDQSFTRFKDFNSQGAPFTTQEPALIKDINQQLTEDIYNKAFANW